MASPCTALFALIGFLIYRFEGALVGALFSAILFAGLVISIHRSISNSGILVKTDKTGISLNYVEIRKSLSWDEIESVRLTRSILWRNLIILEGGNVRINLNLNVQPLWRDLLADLSKNIPAKKLRGFSWDEVRL